MALVLADRVQETSTTTGTGTLTLAGASSGYQTFSAGIGNGNTCYYTIQSDTGAWEVGVGTVGAGTLARTTLISSSTGSAISFTGTLTVFVTYPAEKAVYGEGTTLIAPTGALLPVASGGTGQSSYVVGDVLYASTTTALSKLAIGTTGQVLTVTDGIPSWATNASGDVVGPASATDNAVARYDGTTGKIIQNSAVTIADDGATVIAANSTTDGLRITQIGTGNALVVEDAANPDATPTIIDSAGRVVLGNTAAITMAGTTPTFQLQTAGGSIQQALASWGTNTAHRGDLQFMRSASGVIGTQGAVANNYDLGALNFYGDDGTAFIQAAQILSEVDGTPGTNDMPGRLVFSTTADGASSPTERMRIDNAGRVGIGSVSTQASLAVTTTLPAASGFSQAFRGAVTYDPSVTTNSGYTFHSAPLISAGTLPTLRHFNAQQGTYTGSVTNQFGYFADSTLTGATNNYGFYGNIASGTGRYNFYAAGTAANVFVGTTSIGGTVGSESLRVTPVASAVNFLDVLGSVTTASPSIAATGSDTNIGITLTPKGTGVVSTTSITLSNTLTTAAYTETIVASGTVGASATLAITAGTVLTATLTSATACTFTMPTATAGKSFTLLLKQPAAGTPTTATFTGVNWNASGAPTITATLGRLDILAFVADGTNWYGTASQGYTY